MTTATPPDAPAVNVRPAQRADLLAVYRIETEAFGQPWPFRAFEQYLDSPAFLVASGDSILGYIIADIVSEHSLPVGHIKNLAVRDDARGRGIGSLLLRRAIAILKANNVQAIKLEVREGNDPAIGLYRSHGFEYRTTVEEYYDDGEDALLLVREPGRSL